MMLTPLLQLELAIFLFGLAALVFYRLVTGGINLSGLLYQVDPVTGVRGFSPARVQLLVVTLLGAGYYVIQVASDPSHLPDIPTELLALQGGSGVLYLGFKAFRVFQMISKFQ